MSDGADTEILQQCDVVGREGESLSEGVSATTLWIRRQPIPIKMIDDDMYDMWMMMMMMMMMMIIVMMMMMMMDDDDG